MANRRFTQFMYSLHKMPVRIDLDVLFGATGAVTSFAALGVQAVLRMATGIYRIQLQDNYTNFYGMRANMREGATGAIVAGGAFVVGTTYQILTMGTTTQAQWTAAGVPPGVTAQPGVVFTAATVGAGTGTAQAFLASGVFQMSVVGNPVFDLQPLNMAGPNLGGFIFISTRSAAGALVDPVAGSTLQAEFYLSNSTSTINGIS